MLVCSGAEVRKAVQCSLLCMSDVVTQLREELPQLQNIYYWQDNAGPYHCGTTIGGAKLIGQQHGVSVRRMDVCDSLTDKGLVTGKQQLSSRI